MAEEKYNMPAFDNADFQIITVDPEKYAGETDIDKFADSVTFIPLQTTDSLLIGNIEKLLVWNGNFYIWDRITASVFCFDENGKIKFRINNKGNGPNEYPIIENISVNQENGNVYIYSGPAHAIYKYNTQGEFVEKLICDCISIDFAVAAQDTLLCYTGKFPNMYLYQSTFPKQYRFTVLHKGEVQKRGLESTFQEEWTRLVISPNHFRFYGDTLLLGENINNRIYTITSDNELKPRYRVVFTTNANEFSFDQQAADINYFNSGAYLSLYRFSETASFIFLDYIYKGFLCQSIFNKTNNNLYNIGVMWISKERQMSLPIGVNAVDAKRNIIYQVMESSQIKQLTRKSTQQIKQQTDKIDETDNPVIIKYILKDEV